MSEYFFGSVKQVPNRKTAKAWDQACKDCGGHGLIEWNVKVGDQPGVNNGHYQGNFIGPNRGAPYDHELAARVRAKIGDTAMIEWP